MPKVAATLQNVPSKDPNWLRMRNVWERASRVINGGISFGTRQTLSGTPTQTPPPPPAVPGTEQTIADNMRGTWILLTTPGAGTDITVTHNIGSIPVGYLIMTKSAPVDIYTSPNNVLSTKTIVLRASVAGVRVQLFILG